MDRDLATMLREIARTTADTESRVSSHRNTVEAAGRSSYRLPAVRITSTSIFRRVIARSKFAA